MSSQPYRNKRQSSKKMHNQPQLIFGKVQRKGIISSILQACERQTDRHLLFASLISVMLTSATSTEKTGTTRDINGWCGVYVTTDYQELEEHISSIFRT
jgi:hypothetical protein